MMLEFSVENFLSFKGRVTFSMLASKDTEHDDTNVITLENGKRYLKTAVIYGANASGKSNLLKAMSFMFNFVKLSHQMQIGTEIDVVPFKLDSEYLDKPSRFEIIIICEGIKYAYGFSANRKEVTEEYLYYYPNGRQSLIFERSINDEYCFTVDKDVQKELKERNTPNKLYLSTATNWNYEKVKHVFNWFNDMSIYNDDTVWKYIGSSFGFDKHLFEYAENWVKSMDTGISQIKPNFLLAFPNENNMKEVSERLNELLDISHTQISKDGSKQAIAFKFNEESEGTKRFFLMALDMAGVLLYGRSVLLIDELDMHLHSLLSKNIIEKFHSIDNSNSTQLIFTTHDTNLLDLNLFRRDQIWFTEKKPDTGATDLYSLYDFGVRKDVNIEKGYLLGRYGAIPFIGGNING